MIKHTILIIIILVIIYFASLAYNYAVFSQWRLDPETARSLLKSGRVDLLLDVRTELERKTLGTVPNDVHIPAADIEKVIPSRYPDKSMVILVYCNTGHRARLATDKLQKLGYSNTYYISSTHTTLL